MLSSSKCCASSDPLWDLIFHLVFPRLDPKTLARAACVSKSWQTAASSDLIWAPICLSQYPSLSSLMILPMSTTNSYHRLYSLAYTSSHRHRHRPNPHHPSISLHHLAFAIDVSSSSSSSVILMTLAVDGRRLTSRDGVFHFEIDVESGGGCDEEEVRVRWSVVLKEWRGVFVVMDYVGKGMRGGGRRWFTEEVPSPPESGCTCGGGGGGGGLVGEVELVLGERRKVERVRVGLMRSVACWRYVSVDDGLSYLQRFLLPSSN
ncbi:hypothetical protein Scep_007762 [Stephania cephalantha]|uniref:F-box protein n=1 Tax=Stephania cephalantha TaxID=152367 RepID=A0AAP0PP37_9MAGN